MTLIGRRDFVRQVVSMAGLSAVASCLPPPTATAPSRDSARLSARPLVPTRSVTPGSHSIGISSGRDGLLYVPTTYDPAHPTALVVGLHGAGGSASGQMQLLSSFADTLDFVFLAIDSRDRTWDASFGGFGPDVAFIDDALHATFEQCAIAPSRAYLEGFSDGASYTLGLGIENGDLFSRLVAFSPGFIPLLPNPPVGSPSVFVSHGVQDTILPYENTARSIVPRLEEAGYPVQFQTFDGPHTVPSDIAAAAMQWLIRR